MEYLEFKERTIAILQDWFQALENGTAEYRNPDPRFVRPNDKPPYTDEEVDRVIAALDEEIDGEIQRNKSHWAAKGIQIGSAFARLAPLQRRALVEDLARVVAQWQREEKAQKALSPEEEARIFGIAPQETEVA